MFFAFKGVYPSKKESHSLLTSIFGASSEFDRHWLVSSAVRGQRWTDHQLTGESVVVFVFFSRKSTAIVCWFVCLFVCLLEIDGKNTRNCHNTRRFWHFLKVALNYHQLIV